jgi:hypothetical protein
MPLPFLMGVFPAGAAAAAAPSGAAMTLSGSLSTTASSSTITSTARTVTVPVGNSGGIEFRNLLPVGDGGTLLARKNAGVYQTILDGTVITFADTDTLTLSVTGALNVGDGVQIELIDSTNASSIQTPALFRV